MLILYEIIYLVGFLAYLPGVLLRKRLPHRDWSMRLGRYPRPLREAFSGKSSIWVHAVSVGEVLAARPLLTALKEVNHEHSLVLSTITPSGFEVASKFMQGLGTTIYLPLDVRVFLRRAFDAFNPQILVLMESELWPMTLQVAKERGVAVIVANGRVSPRSFKRSVPIRSWLSMFYKKVDQFLVQSLSDSDRFCKLGVSQSKIQVTGNLKWDASCIEQPRLDQVRMQQQRLGLQKSIPIIVAGSTHRGEEEGLLQSYKKLRVRDPRVRLIIAPRHLERLQEVEHCVKNHKLKPLKTSKASGHSSWDVAIVDTFGELPLFYAMASVVVVGGSFIPHGGQNPLEPASLGKPVCFGPHMHNFSDIVDELLKHDAACQLENAQQLSSQLEKWLQEPTAAAVIGKNAQELVMKNMGSTQRTLEILKPYLSGVDFPLL